MWYYVPGFEPNYKGILKWVGPLGHKRVSSSFEWSAAYGDTHKHWLRSEAYGSNDTEKIESLFMGDSQQNIQELSKA